jgi:AraC-like DNA-binding protein
MRLSSSLAFLLAAAAGVAAVAAQSEIGELKSRLAGANDPRQRLLLLNQIAYHVNVPPVPADEALRYTQEAISLARSLSDRGAEALALHNQANAYRELQDFQRALDCYFQSRMVGEAAGNIVDVARSDREIGHILHFCYSDLASANRYYAKAVEEYRAAGQTLEQARTANAIGEVYRKQGRWVAAVEAYLEALRLNDSVDVNGSRHTRATILANLGEATTMLPDFDRARAYLGEAMSLFEAEGYPRGKADVLARLGELRWLEGQHREALALFTQALELVRGRTDPQRVAAHVHMLAAAKARVGDIPGALEQFQLALKMRRQSSDVLGTCQTLQAIGQTYLTIRNYPQARTRLQESLRIAERSGFPKERQALYRDLSQLYSALGDPQLELEYRKRYEQLTDELQLPRMHAAVVKILDRYEHDKTITELAQVQKQKGRMILVFLLVVVPIVIVVGLLWINQRRITAWARTMLNAKQEQISEQQSQLIRLRERLCELEAVVPQEKYKASKLSSEQARVCLRQLLEIMENEKAFLQPDLTLESLARRLGINRTYLSQTINEHLGLCYYDFINRLRVEEAKALLAKSDDSPASIADIGFSVGFGSKSNYYKAFKRFTGLTPVQYRANVHDAPPVVDTDSPGHPSTWS